MNTFTISSTELKNETADILNRVYYEKQIAIVERHGETIARIIPERKVRVSKGDTLKKLFGILPDFPDVKRKRYNPTRKVSL